MGFKRKITIFGGKLSKFDKVYLKSGLEYSAFNYHGDGEKGEHRSDHQKKGPESHVSMTTHTHICYSLGYYNPRTHGHPLPQIM